jgi:hypothetical protein
MRVAAMVAWVAVIPGVDMLDPNTGGGTIRRGPAELGRAESGSRVGCVCCRHLDGRENQEGR